MADEKKQPTKEEIEKKRNEQIGSLESNLKNDFYFNILGGNTLRNEELYSMVLLQNKLEKVNILQQ